MRFSDSGGKRSAERTLILSAADDIRAVPSLLSGEEMTSCDSVWRQVGDRLAGRSFHVTVPLCGGVRSRKCRGAHQVIGDHAESDPAVHAIEAMVATPVESMPSFQNANAAFRADTPPLPATEPPLTFIGLPRWRLRAAPRQDHTSHAAIDP